MTSPSEKLYIQDGNEARRKKKMAKIVDYLIANEYEFEIKKTEITTLEYYSSGRVGIGA